MPKREDERHINLKSSMRWCSVHQCWYRDPADCPYRRRKDVFANVVWPNGMVGSGGLLFANVIWPDENGNYQSR